MLCAAALCGAALIFTTPAAAQNLALRAPQWAQAMLSSDVTPTTGGRSLILAEGIPLAEWWRRGGELQLAKRKGR